MKFKVALLLILVLCSACFATQPQKEPVQGLSGYIYLVTGNQMPTIGRPQNKGRGVMRDIYIYQPATISQTTGNSTLFTAVKTKLIAQTKSDSTGHYLVKLAAGKYSVFIKEGDQFFAAESDGTGAINPVEITLNTLTKKDFTINNNAAY